MRRALTIPIDGAILVASLDEGTRDTALLIVTGGLQVRAGAHGGQARLAQAVAAAGHPVLRFDRRGIGDSDGADPGWRGQGPDIAAAAARAPPPNSPHVRHIVGYGLCDAAAALALHAAAAGLDALLLANPWVVEPAGTCRPAAIRHRYRERLLSRDAWTRLLCCPDRPAPRPPAACVPPPVRRARSPTSSPGR